MKKFSKSKLFYRFVEQKQIIMTDGIAIKKDITVEAKKVLKNAMQANCGEYYKRKYINERIDYWTSLGYSIEVATEKANEDYEWCN